MEKEFIVNNKSIKVEIENTGKGKQVILGDNKYMIADVVTEQNEISFMVNNKKIRTFAASDKEKVFVFERGRQYIIEKPDEGVSKYDTSVVSRVKGDYISSPMPGTIIKIKCKPGDNVKENDTLVIVEAMKMENLLKSPADGVIGKINFSDGDLVDAGAPIVELV